MAQQHRTAGSGKAGHIEHAALVPPHFRPTVIATSVALAVSAPGALAQWTPNAEVYVKPGDDRSYTGIDGVLPLWQSGTALLFGDLKAKLGEHDTHEFNLGLAYRRLTTSQDWAWGGYLAYDQRRARSGHDFNQVTVGAEGRSVAWDFRVNYYHPTSDKHLLGTGATSFQDFRVFRNGIYEEPMRGADVEVGALLPFTGKIETRVFLAGYTLKAEDLGTHADGARLRLEVRPRQDIILGASVQHDNLFKTAWFVEARYAFGKAPVQGVRKLTDRMTDPWTRDTDVVITPATESTNIALALQQPGRVVHIDSSKPAGGDGSFERPYSLVAACETDKCGPAGGAYNLVRLWRGNSGATPYTPVTLQPGRTLWGEGLDIFTHVASPGLRPVISGAGDAITLAPGSNFTVVGVDARSTGASGLSGTNVFGAISVTDSAFSGAANGIAIANTAAASATIDITRNSITAGSAAAANGIALSGIASGVSATQTATISGNTISVTSSGAGAAGYGVGIRLYNQGDSAGTATQNVTISGNTIAARATGGGVAMGIRAFNRGNNGAATAPGAATQNVTLTGNTITATESASAFFGVGMRSSNYGGGAGSNAMQAVTISGNNMQSSGSNAYGASFFAGSLASGGAVSQTATISGNTFSQTAAAGSARSLVFNPTNGNVTAFTQSATVSGNTIGAAGAGAGAPVDGVFVVNTNSAAGALTQALTLTGNTINATNSAAGGTARGVFLNVNQAAGTARQTTVLTGNTVSANASATGGTGTGVLITGNTANQATTLPGNTITRSGAAGATVDNTGGAGPCTGGGVPSCP